MTLPATWTSDFPFHLFFFLMNLTLAAEESSWENDLTSIDNDQTTFSLITESPVSHSPMMLLVMGTNNSIYSGFLFSESMQGSSLEGECLCKCTNVFKQLESNTEDTGLISAYFLTCT